MMRYASYLRRASADDRGVSLVELVVSMTIMAVFLVIFTGSAVSMYQATNKSEAISDTTSQVAQAFNRLDTSIRYAADISKPGVGSDGNWYVEWGARYESAPACTQLRLDTQAGQLQQRTWGFDTDAHVTNLTTWRPLASFLTATDPANGSGVTVFTRDLDPDTAYQQLTIHVIAKTGKGNRTTATGSTVTFTALNSHRSTESTNVCQQEGRP